MSLPNLSEHRESTRYPINWMAAVVFERNDGRTIVHGSTQEISTGGASVILDVDFGSIEVVTLFLAVPPLRLYQPKVMIEVRSLVRQVARLPDREGYRVDFEFKTFRGTGQTMLEKVLTERATSTSGDRRSYPQ